MDVSKLKDLLYSIADDVPNSLYNHIEEDDTGVGCSIVTREYVACFHMDNDRYFTDLTIKRFNNAEEAENMVEVFKFIDATSDIAETPLS